MIRWLIIFAPLLIGSVLPIWFVWSITPTCASATMGTLWEAAFEIPTNISEVGLGWELAGLQVYTLLEIAVLAAIGIGVDRARRRRLKESAGLCAICGYDLRATPTRCPECGVSPQTPTNPASASIWGE